MNWIKHSQYEGQHAFLGASNYHWLNYTDDKLASTYSNLLAKARGTELHEFAAQCIRLGQRLPKTKNTLNMYVNDAIGYKMTPEVVLFYSDNWFGTADTISFRNNFLRIHDYKSGVTQAHIDQLEIYAALFCVEYKHNPEDIKMELRLYQNNEIIFSNPTPERIRFIMNKGISGDRIINKVRSGEV